jgi:hypothetical protein
MVSPLSADAANATDSELGIGLYLTDPDGRHSGIDPTTGQVVDEIPDVAFSGTDSDPQAISIPDLNGNWAVQVVGEVDTAYELQAIMVDPAEPVTTLVSGRASDGQVDTYNISAGVSGEGISIEPAGAPTPAITPTPTPTPTPIHTPTGSPSPRIGGKGDVNCDGDIDAVDALQILRSVAALPVNQSGACPEIGSEHDSVFGDMDCDSDVDAVDALWILRYVAALPLNLPQDCAALGG